MRILIVDDEPDVLLLCRVNLEITGHEVLEAPNGEHGLEVALRERPDVIVLDLMLPARDGLAVLTALRADEATREIPVILLTAKTLAEDRLAGWRAGCTEYVTKPFSPLALVDLVNRVAEMSPRDRLRRRERELARLALHA